MNTSINPEILERDGAVRKHYMSLEAGVKIPLLQAFISALLLSVLVAMIAGYLGVKAWWNVLGISFIVLFCGAWLLSQRRWYSLVLKLEEAFQVDFTGDNEIGAPVETVRVELSRDDTPGSHQEQYLEIKGIGRARLRSLASGALSGIPLSESAWCGAHKPFSKKEFHQVRGELIKRGWLAWKNPEATSLGVEITRPGRAVFKRLSSLPIESSPTE